MEQFKSALAKCLISLADCPELFTDCVDYLTHSVSIVLKSHTPDSLPKLASCNGDSRKQFQWLFFPLLHHQNASCVQHPYFELSKHGLFQSQQHLVSLLLYHTQMARTLLMQQNHDVFAQHDTAVEPDDQDDASDVLFFIPPLYCCPDKFYFSTRQFLRLVYECKLHFALLHCLTDDDEATTFDIFAWLHRQYCNAQRRQYVDDIHGYREYCLQVILDAFKNCELGASFICQLVIRTFAHVNARCLQNAPHERCDNSTLLSIAMSCLQNLDDVQLADKQSLFAQLNVWLFLRVCACDATDNDERKNRISWRVLQHAFAIWQPLTQLPLLQVDVGVRMKDLIYHVHRFVSDIITHIDDTTDWQTYLQLFFTFDAIDGNETGNAKDALFYCRVLLKLKRISLELQHANNVHERTTHPPQALVLSLLKTQLEHETVAKHKLMRLWNERLYALSMAEIVDVLRTFERQPKHRIAFVMQQLVQQARADTAACFSHEYSCDLCAFLQSHLDCINSLPLCQMMKHVYKQGIAQQLQNCTCTKWKQLFLESYALLPPAEQYIVCKQIYHHEDGDGIILRATDIDDDIEDRILFFFNSLSSDVQHNVLSLREFSILALIAPHKTIEALLSNMMLHTKHAKLLASLCAQYPLLLIFAAADETSSSPQPQTLIWRQLSQYAIHKLKHNQTMETQQTRSIHIFVKTLLDNADQNVFIVPYVFKFCLLPWMANFSDSEAFSVLLSSVIVPVLRTMYEVFLTVDDTRLQQRIQALHTDCRRYDLRQAIANDSQSLELFKDSLQCLQWLLTALHHTSDTDTAGNMQNVNALQMCLPLNVQFLHRMYTIYGYDVRKQTIYETLTSSPQKWNDTVRLRLLFQCHFLQIDELYLDEKDVKFARLLLNAFDNKSVAVCSDFWESDLQKYNLDLVRIACMDDECCMLAVDALRHQFGTDTFKLVHTILLPALVRLLPILCENEICRLLQRFLPKICCFSQTVMIIFRSLKQLLLDMDNVRYNRILNCCLRAIATYSDGSSNGMVLRYTIYRNSTELLFRMYSFRFNTNYIFIFLCDIMKRMLDDAFKLQTDTSNEISSLVNLELKQLPDSFRILLNRILSDCVSSVSVSDFES